MKSTKTAALIMSGGKGARMGANVSKQYLELNGRPILAITIAKFQQVGLIDEIIIVTPEEDILYCEKHIVEGNGFNKVKAVVSGGRTRQESTYKGLKAVSSGIDYVLIHDAVRPFIQEEQISSVIQGTKAHGACIPCVPVKDTIKAGEMDDTILTTLDRKLLLAAQTPQGFKKELIILAHEKAAQDLFEGTDDSSFVERLGITVYTVMGSYDNIKITTTEDLLFAEYLLSKGVRG